MKTKIYSLKKTEEGYALVPEKGKGKIDFKDKMGGFDAIMVLASQLKISLETADSLNTAILALEDLDTLIDPEGDEVSPEQMALAEKLLQLKANELKRDIIIKNHKEGVQLLPCKNCGKHGIILTKDFYTKVNSKFEALEIAESLLTEKKITPEEKDELDLQIVKSSMRLKSSSFMETSSFFDMLFSEDLFQTFANFTNAEEPADKA